MNRFVGFVVLSVLSVTFSVTASAVLVPLGTAQGGIGAYFNSGTGLGENPANMAYWEAQTALGATNGMYFQFDTTVLPILGQSFNDIFSGQPAGSSQFGFDMLGIALTWDGVEPLPTFDFYDNVDNTAANVLVTPSTTDAAGEFAWAINDYKGGPGVGVYGANATVYNSLFRGTSASVDTYTLSPILGPGGIIGYTVDLAGWLNTDGLIHWYNPALPDTTLASAGLGNAFYFEGSFTYLQEGDTSSNMYDFYGGMGTLYAEIVPEPASLTLMALGLGGLAALRLRKRA